MSVTTPAGLPGRRRRRRPQADRRARTSPSSSTTARRTPPPASSPPTAARPTRCCGARRSSRTASSARSCSTPAAPTATPAPRASRPPTPSPSRSPTGLGIGAVDVVGLLHRPDRRWPTTATGAAAGVDAAVGALGRATAATDAAARDHDHRLGQQAGRRRGRRLVASAGWPRAPGMLAPQLATMLVVLTTDAVVDAGDLDARAAGRDPGQLRPARLRRLHVHQRHRHRCWPAAPAGSRRRAPDFTEALTRACTDLAMQLLARRRGRRPRDRDHRAARGHRGRRGRGRPQRSPAATCSRPRSSATTPTGAGCSPPSAPPRRPSTRPTSTSR